MGPCTLAFSASYDDELQFLDHVESVMDVLVERRLNGEWSPDEDLGPVEDDPTETLPDVIILVQSEEDRNLIERAFNVFYSELHPIEMTLVSSVNEDLFLGERVLNPKTKKIFPNFLKKGAVDV